jgi:potassium/hydrogen antiporter
MFETVLVAIAILLMASLLMSKVTSRVGVPALLVFIAIGMLAGSEGPGRIQFDDPAAAQYLGVLALAMILFSGGLDTQWKSVTAAWRHGVVLSTFGVFATAALVAWFAHQILGLSLTEGLLLGAIVSSTDAAAVFAVLRGRGVHLQPRVRSILELESGSNDPMAVFLTIGVIGLLLQPEMPIVSLVPMFLMQMTVGALLGVASGKFLVWLVNHAQLDFDGLYPVLTISIVLLTYGASSLLGGNGFLAVYLAGLTAGRANYIHRRSLMRFHDGLAWLMQIAMFLALGLLVYPSALIPVAGVSLAIALFLMFVARPLAVAIALIAFRLPWRELTFVSWVGLRGAVPIILATFPLLAGIGQAPQIFNIVFFIVLTSVVLQGTSVPLVARWLRVELMETGPAGDPELPIRHNSELITVEVAPGSPAIDRKIVELGLPFDAYILLIYRGGGFFSPTGGSELREGDRLMTLVSRDSSKEVRRRVEGPGTEKVELPGI